MIQFLHRRISKAFIAECEGSVLGGQSVALLGPRFGGKSYVHRELRKRLVADAGEFVLSFRIRTHDRVRSLDSIQYLQHFEGKEEIAEGDPLAAVRTIRAERKRPVVLLGANVDCLPPEVARRFLEKIRTLVEDRVVTAVLSGALDFRDLVHGPNSEFNCANQYVLLGFDQETFREQLEEYSERHRIAWADMECASRRLWEFTGGNWHVSRLLISIADERQRITGGPCDAELSPDILDTCIRSDSIPGTYWASLVRRPVELISAEPDCWPELEALLSAGTARARSLDGAPGPLELSSVAIREGANLCFASPFSERLLKKHFTEKRLGDLYAQDGQWFPAFAHYAKRDGNDGARPSDPEDRIAVRSTVQALGSAMFAAAKQGVTAVRQLFEQGAALVLGFPEVSFWERRQGWVQVESPRPLPDQFSKQIDNGLPSNCDTPGIILLPEALGRFALAASLRTESAERPLVVILSGLVKREVVSRQRNALAIMLLEFFVDAHEQALQSGFNARRLETRNQHVKILNQIYDFLGGPVFDVEQILHLTGTELLKLGYRRVMFCLVDARRKNISGILDIPGTHALNLANITEYSLEGEITDLQQWVVRHAAHRIVPDFASEPLANKRCLLEKEIKAIAIVPILDRHDRAVGTIHIERADSGVPSEQEVTDLKLFGRQLARMLAQHERVTLLQKSLDGSAEPLMITDADARIVYANKQAAQPLGIGAGWQEQPCDVFASDSKIAGAVRQAIQPGGKQSIQQIEIFGNERSYRGEVLVDSLLDWRGQVIGSFVEIHDLRWLLNVMDAITKIGPAPDTEAALEAIFESVGSFGYTGIRLFVIDPATGQFRSRRARGLNPDAEERFIRGEVVLPPHNDARAHSWRVLDRHEPLIFHWRNGTGEEVKSTRYGLAVTELTDPVMPVELGKKEGDYWLEIPLYIGDSLFGKLAIDCDPDIRPEAFETMRLLVETSANLLAACGEREKQEKARREAIREGLETSMATVAHNLGSRLAALPLILARYKLRQEHTPELKPVNDDFSFLIEHTMETIKRIRELLNKVTPRYSVFGVGEMLERVLSASLAPGQYSVECEMPVSIEADSDVLEAAVVELIQNSRQFARDAAKLKVAIDVRIDAVLGRATIEFRDNGPGVPELFKTRIFDEFFAHRPGMKRGTGLGLAFVRRALEAHSGSAAESGRHGEGVRFILELPIRRLA